MPWFDKYKQVADNASTNIPTPTGKSIVTDNSPYTQNQFLSLMEGMRSGVQYDKQQEQNRISQRKNAEQAVNNNQPFTLPSGKTKKFSDMDFREKRYVEGTALENRGRIFPNEESIIDDLNPLNWIASMAGNMSKAPYEAKQQDSYIPYLTSVGAPLAAGVLGSLGAKTTGQFVNNIINPIGVDITRVALNNPIWKKKVLSEIAEGNKWSKEWYSNPITKERYDNFVHRGNPYLGEKAALENSNLMSHFENVDFDQPLFKSINLDKNIAAKNHATVARNNYEKLLTEGKLTEGVTELLDQNRNVLGRYRYDSNDAKIDILHPSFLFKGFKPKTTTIHENIHALTRGNKALLPEAKKSFKAAFGNQQDKYDKYLTEPTEIHARIGEIRNHFNLTPESLIYDEYVDDIIKQGLKGKTPVDERFFQLIKDKEQFKWLMNNAPAVALPIVGAAALQEKQKGGSITGYNWLDKYKK